MEKQIQINLSEIENRIVEMYKAIHGLGSKRDSVKKIILEKIDLIEKIEQNGTNTNSQA